MRMRSLFAAAGIFLMLFGGKALAQVSAPQFGGGQPSRTPPFSPYLNLLNANSTPVITYYGIIRPELAFNTSIGQLQQQQNLAGQQQQSQQFAATNVLPPTGHAAGFFTQGRYFFTKGAGR